MKTSLRRALRRLPAGLGLDDLDAVGSGARALAGLSNHSVVLSAADGRRFVLRLPPASDQHDIDRGHERRAQTDAAALGLCPPLVYAAADGLQLSRFIEPGTALDAVALRRRAAAALRLLRRLHDSGRRWPRRRDPLRQIDIYLRRCDRDWRLRLRPLRARLQRRASLLRRRAGALRPCHIDPSPGNFIGGRGRLYLIDWEYAAMSDPLWDVAALAVEIDVAANDAGADADADADADALRLLRIYRRGQRADARLTRRYRAYLAALALVAASWAAMRLNAAQTAVGREYALRRLRQARRWGRV